MHDHPIRPEAPRRPRHRHTGASGRWLRRARRSARRAVALVTAAVLVLGLAVVGTVALSGATSPAQATTPGSPGTPQAATTLYTEGFENNMTATQVLLTDYTGAPPANETYTADDGWLTGCNGEIVEFNTPYTDLGNCANTSDTSHTRQLAYALGAHNGSANPATNHAVTGYTDNAPGADAVEFETVDPIPLASATGRFLTFSVNAAALNCGASAPRYQFSLLSGGAVTPVGEQINPCTSGDTMNVPAVGTQGAAVVHVGTYTSNGSVFFSGSSLGIRMTNANGSGRGNDAAFDDIKILDVTPQLDKSFSPASVELGQSSTLTFTITNTDELAAKNGWSFTDTLPDGLTVTTPAASTTCPSGTVTAATGSSSVQVSGNLDAGMQSCTATVQVTSTTTGTFTNGPGNVSETGLNPPGDTTLTVTDPPPPAMTCTADQTRATQRWWRFGDQAGIDFGTSGTTATAFAAPGSTAEGSTVVTDTGGNLQFWSNGQTIFDSNGDPMPNGSGLLGNPSATQTVAAFPLLNQPGKYAVVTTSIDVGQAPNGTLTYSVVDMALNNGLGDVVGGQKNVPLGAANTASEALTAVPNADGTGFWVYTFTNNSPNVIGYEFDGNGYTGTAVTSVLPGNNGDFYGSLVLSPDGTTLLQETSTNTVPANGPATLRLLTVNAETGKVFQKFAWAGSTSQGRHGYTADFSPNGDYVYFSRIFDGGELYRYTIAGASSSAEIKASEQDLGSTGPTGGHVARGPDGKVYVANTGQASLSVVNTPNAADPGFVQGGFPLAAGSTSNFGLPQMVTGCAPPVEPSYTVTKTASTSGPVHPGDTVTYTVVVQNTGLVAYTAAHPASFTDNLAQVVDDATYNNDADNGATVSGNTLSWSGALAPQGSAGDSVTITYTVTVNTPDTGDQSLDNAAVTPPEGGGNCPAGSTDPACSTSVPVQSFRVVKTTTAGEVIPGATVDYTITVTNTGGVDYTTADPASFTDDLTSVLDDATYNSDADASAGDVNYTAPTLSWSGALAVGDSVTVTYSVTVNTPDSGDQHLDNTVVTPDGSGGNCPDGSTDPACRAQVPSKSFSVVKSASEQPANAGDTVTYTITVTNTGSVDYTAADPASLTDDLTGVLDDATYNDDASNGATYDADSKTLSWSGALPAGGAPVVITYSVTVDSPDSGDQQLDNTVTTPPGSGGACAADNTDPGCGTSTPVRSYTVAKSAGTGNAQPGDTISYTVTVTNTGAAAYTSADPATFTDDLTDVLDDATYNGDADNGATYTAPTLSWSGALPAGGAVTVTYSVTVNDPDAGDGTLTNAADPAGPGGACADGSAAPCDPVNVPVASYTVTKTADPAGTVHPGDTISYTITVHNPSEGDYTAADPASFTDDLSAVLDDATYNGDASASAGTADYTAPTLSWSGALAAGATVSVTYSVTVIDPATGNGDGALTNAANPTGPGGGCADGSEPPCAPVTDQVQSYSVTKTSSATDAQPGDAITYTITVTNTGAVDYTSADPASVTDNLSQVLDDAAYNGDGSATAGDVSYAAPTLSWSGALATGATVTVTYSVTVNDPDTGDHSLDNAAVTPDGSGGTCPTGSTDPACSTTTPVQSFSVVKTADQPKVTPGATVTYTVVVTNTGQVDYTATDPASFTDDLSAVLDDAAYNGDVDASAGDASYTEPTLSWTGALAIGAKATITYSVTVDSPDTGDQKMNNTVVTPDGSGGNCPTGSTDPQCTTRVPGNQLKVSKTASAAAAAPGQTITYTITVVNTGQVDFTAADPASFTDDLSGVLDDASYNGDASDGATVKGDTLSWFGALAVGDSVQVTYSVTVDQPDTGDKLLKNVVALPPGENSNCTAGSTDPACATTTPVEQYTVVKKASDSKVKAGDTVTYTITVTNTGQVAFTDADPASFTDDLSMVLDDATYNGDASNGATVTDDTLSWSGALPLAGTVTVTYSVTVNDADTGDGHLHNVVTTPTDPGGLTPANCGTGTSDPHCATDTGVEAAAVTDPQGGGSSLASTGNDTQLQLLLGGLLLGSGGLLVLLALGRRRSRQA